MCSVIEIKNANEYYIHYHSPESMVTPAASDVSVMSSEKALKEGGGVGVDGGGQNKEANNTISNDHVVEANAETSTKLKRSSKDQEVTSDRGSSASPSLEDEEENTTTPAPTTLPQQQKSSVAPEVASEANNKSPSKIPVRSFKKLPAPQPPTTSQQTTTTTSSSTSTSTPTAATNTVTPSNTKSKSGKSKGTNPFETDENEESSSKTQPQQSRPRSAAAAASARSALPRPSPPKSSPSISASASVSPASAKNKLTPARSCESVPITVNSHIPASPLRPTGLTKRRVTSEMATQVEATTTTTKTSKSTSASSNNNNKNKNNTAMKSASEENLANLEEKAKKPNLFKKTSESSDPICNTGSNAKWSYTNGRGKTFQRTFCR